MLASLDLEVILETISREIVRAGIFRSLVLAMVHEKSHSVEVVHCFVHALNSKGEVIPGAALRASDNVAGLRYDLDDPNIMSEVTRTEKMVITDENDPRFDNRVVRPTQEHRACYFVPIKSADRVIAVISTGSPAQERDNVLRRIHEMGPLLDQAAIAIEHGRLYRETTQSEHDAQVGLAVQRIRTEILQMQTSDD